MPETKSNNNKKTSSPPTIMSKISSSIYSIILFLLYISYGILLCYMKFVWNDMLNAQFTRNEFFKYIGLSEEPGLLMSIVNLVTSSSQTNADLVHKESHKVTTTTIPSLPYSIDNKTMYKHLFNDNHAFITNKLNEYRKNRSNVLYKISAFYLAEIYYIIYSFASIFYDSGMSDIVIILLGPLIVTFFLIITLILVIFILPLSIVKGLEYEWGLYAYPLTFFIIILLYFVFVPIIPILHIYFFIKCVRGMFIDVKQYIDKDKPELNVSDPIKGTVISSSSRPPSDPIKGTVISVSSPPPSVPIKGTVISSSTPTPIPNQSSERIPEPTPEANTKQEVKPINETNKPPEPLNSSSQTSESPSPPPEGTLDNNIKGGSIPNKKYISKNYTYSNYLKDMLITNGWLQYIIFFFIILQLYSINNIIGLIFTGILVLLVLYNFVKYKRIFFKTYNEKKAIKHDWLIDKKDPILLYEPKKSFSSKVMDTINPLISKQIRSTLNKINSLDIPVNLSSKINKF